MDKKERVLAAMRLRPVDRIPTMYRGVVPFSKRLMKYFKIGNQNDPLILIKNYGKLLEALNADIWTIGSCQYFSNFVPKYIGPEIENKEDTYFSTLGIKTSSKYLRKYDYNYLVIEKSPLHNCENPKEVIGYLTKRIKYFDYENCINQQLNRGDYYRDEQAGKLLGYENIKSDEETVISIGNVMCYPYMLCAYLRGMDQFLLDLVSNIKMAEAVIYEVNDFLLEFNKNYFSKTKISADLYSAWDDVATQDSLMFSPEMFKKYYLTFWEEIISMVKTKGLIFNWHCCGNVNDVLPMMIDAGIDVFDVVQTSARDMEIEKFYKKFGKDVCIHGGIDVQKLLVSGKPKDIKEEVKKFFDLYDKKGGLILGPSHEIVPDTPVKNIIYLYEFINELNLK